MTLSAFHPVVRDWFASHFAAPTEAQRLAWDAVRSAPATLLAAPTGSGKTLAAFLTAIDGLVKKSASGRLEARCYVLYVSPLKALSNDIQKNLERPLLEIGARLLAQGLGHDAIRAWVRTGDTPQSERARMIKQPPHILVTTPESLYILLTSESGRRMLATVETVIVDEIHALAGNKRGAHLALSLERLAALCPHPLVRIGLSATSEPVSVMAEFLTGSHPGRCAIVDVGHARSRDLALELPSSPLEPVMAAEVWGEIYDRLASLAGAHRTTLVFVNTRRMAERVARHLAERLGEREVTAHHGSLAKEHRLAAEQRLKRGELRALVATASLELGIDVGEIDLVCQLGSPRAIASFLQRVGRSGHGVARTPKGRLFPLTRDELVECVALLESARRGELDAVRPCEAPLDVLAQQIVAEVAMREWQVDALYVCLTRSYPYRHLTRQSYRAVVDMLADGFTTHRGRRGAHLHFDRVNGLLRGRRGARLFAITNGGVIPDQFDYDVLLGPNEQFVGTLNEDFAFESMAGDVFQLGAASYRITRVASGKVYVEDAHGQAPTIPFWLGEAPGRSDELSAAVSDLRLRLDEQLRDLDSARVTAWAMQALVIDRSAAEQLVEYLASGRAALGGLPHGRRIVLERFFDEAGDSHLVIHSTFGSRINRAWGLALRKRFCRRFNFELQAAALEDAIVLSLGTVHSFPLEDVPRYLNSRSVRDTLTQAVLTAPVFPGRWRWNATTALAVRRFYNGRRAPAAFQRNDAEDLLATVFPDQLACAENIVGERSVPEHPLVEQTLRDCLTAVMDIEGLERLLAQVEAGEVEIHCCELTAPSPLAQEVLVAKPYAFLDDAPAEERRTRAIEARRYLSVEQAGELGRLDPAAIARVRAEAWPEPRSADELYEALTLAGFMTDREVAPTWQAWLDELRRDGRAGRLQGDGITFWVAAERWREMRLLYPLLGSEDGVVSLPSSVTGPDEALRELLRSRLEVQGPVSVVALGELFGTAADGLPAGLAALEQEGFAIRGRFSAEDAEEWCERRLLARIHRYTLTRLRQEIEPVSIADYQRFLFRWQGLGPQRREGPDALAAIIGELQGLGVGAAAWEREVLPARLVDYAGDLADALSIRGDIVWWRPWSGASETGARVAALASAPVMLSPRADWQHWQALATLVHGEAMPRLSTQAERVGRLLQERGALFFVEIVQASGLLRVQVEDALAELATLGFVTADAVHGLRALATAPSRRRGFSRRGRLRGPTFDAAGRWAWTAPWPEAAARAARSAAIAHAARCLLRRYGIVCRALLARETCVPSWRDLVQVYRRWEASGEIRGGRFIGPLTGEQFALADAIELLRKQRREPAVDEWQAISAADPLNLTGIVDAGRRVPAVMSHRVLYHNGVAVAARAGATSHWLQPLTSAEQARAQAELMPASKSPSSTAAERWRR